MDTTKTCSSSLQLQVVLTAPDLSSHCQALGDDLLWVLVFSVQTFISNCHIFSRRDVGWATHDINIQLLELIQFEAQGNSGGSYLLWWSLIKIIYALSGVLQWRSRYKGSIVHQGCKGTHTGCSRVCDLYNHCCRPSLSLSEYKTPAPLSEHVNPGQRNNLLFF